MLQVTAKTTAKAKVGGDGLGQSRVPGPYERVNMERVWVRDHGPWA